MDLAIKPDVLAVGDNLYPATQKTNPFGALFDAGGYLVNAPGTSFASPIVAGAVALLKGARPGLTAAQYRSLIVNNAANLTGASGSALPIQWTGAGLLDAAAALRASVAVSPVSLSLGAGTGPANLSRTFTITNVTNADDTYAISVAPATGIAPTLDSASVRLAAGSSQVLNLRLSVTEAAVSVSQGYLRIRGSRSDAESVVPYWYAVTDQAPADIAILAAPDTGFAGSLQRIVFRVVDRNGVILSSAAPTVTVIGGSGSSQSVITSEPNYTATVRLGAGGANIYQIVAGSASAQVIIQTQ